MIRITDRSHVPAPPERVWTFFAEWIGRFRLRARARVAEARKHRYLRHEGMFPYSLLRAGGSFTLEPGDNGGCDLVAEVYIGRDVPVFGALLDRLIAAVVPLPELRRHVAEEGRNLARMMDQVPPVEAGHGVCGSGR